MTTQELKNKIERVLGNNIRCLLPSYWWKNLFHSVADRIDEVEQKVDDIVTPTPASASSVLFIAPLTEGEELSAESKSKNAASYRKVVNGFAKNEFYDVKILALFAVIEATVISNPAFTNSVLKLMYEVDSKILILSVSADGSATLEEADDSNGLIFGKERYAYVSRHKNANGNISETSLTEEQRAYNQETNEMLKSGGKVYLSYEGTFWMQVGYSQANSDYTSDYTFYFSTASMVIPHEDKIFGRRMVLSSDGSIDLIDTLVGGSSGDITIDTEMSDTSTNAVQNKVVKKYIDDKVANIEFPPVDAELSDTSTNAVQNKAVKKYMDDEVTVAVNALINYMEEIDEYLETEVSKKVEQSDVDSSIEQATDNIKKIIEESEDVAASAIAQLNAAVEDIINRLNNAGI